uniref:Uncharacterized protein n=1 Tax=Oryza brachyantha TaxID=4533 RepID=J3KZP5_ORYBR
MRSGSRGQSSIPSSIYFDRLQQALLDYDCVLYEMVTNRENLKNRKDPTFANKLRSSLRGFNILGFIQKQVVNILSLDYQLDCLDYGNEKWQHAELHFETFKQLQTCKHKQKRNDEGQQNWWA